MTLSKENDSQNNIENGLKQIPLLFEDLIGTQDNSDKSLTFSVLKEESLNALTAHVGKPIEIKVTKEKWIYMGPDLQDSHTACEEHLKGKLDKVDKFKITVLNEKGNTVNSQSVSKGKTTEIPFQENELSVKKTTIISRIEQIKTQDSIFKTSLK